MLLINPKNIDTMFFQDSEKALYVYRHGISEPTKYAIEGYQISTAIDKLINKEGTNID